MVLIRSLAEKFDLQLPKYPGCDQIVELVSDKTTS